ncbi:major facilitator superfamily domain-containing protein [Fimicolochytrium jonesii]|uniref:major facilitator superfamily domain-containing protein n=1 Tax=Fimicolochytrium jonesii TaxID=1396493 RepID=UPI0022FF1A47|nr:major facilitator superfamily domain-containing protein [Fimicolochytrium jonesii]KAI8819265.1 major facilitator superfamily domain-containing protein [Fimicolochytrium jonesii]
MGQSISEATVHISSVKADIVPLKDEKPPAPRPRPPTPSTTTAVEPYCAYSPTRRYCLLALVALAGALGPLAGNIYLPAMVPIGQSLNASASMINISVSIFMLMFAVAPLGWGSLADRTGRRAVYLISFAVYVAGSIALAFTNSYAYLIVFRLLQATGAASVQSLGGGTLVDLFKPTERGQAMGIFLLGPQLGPLIGPLIGGFLARYAGWKAIFWFLAGLGVALWVAIFFFLPETLRARAGNGKAYAERGWIVVPAPLMKPWDPSRARYNPLAPLKFLRFTSIVLCLSYIAILFGSFYCFNVSIPVILQNEYGYNEAQVGLSYIPVGLGFILGSNVAGRYADRTVKAALKRSEGQPVPETRVRCQWVGLVLFPFGVLLFGFAASFRWHVAVLFLTMFISVFGLTWTFSCNTTYLIDSFPGSAAGVVALNSLFRNPAAAVGSAVIEPFVDEVGYWKSFLTVSIIAWVAAGLVVTVMINGAKWRLAAKSKAPPASGSAESAPGPKRV